MENNKLNDFYKLLNNDKSDIYIKFNNLLDFLNKTIIRINNDKTIFKYDSDINFFDMFYYALKYNSSITSTGVNVMLNINTHFLKNLSSNSINDRLCALNPSIFLNINNLFIKYFYETFNINSSTILTATDGSEIKLLASLKDNFKLNKNNQYTVAYLSSVYDIENNFPLHFDIFKSANEITNFEHQLKKNKYNLINTLDRGYDCYNLFNLHLVKNYSFVARIKKDNSFINHTIINDNNDEYIFEYYYLNHTYNLKIVKYINITKPDTVYNKQQIIEFIDNNNLLINTKKNELINKNKEKTAICDNIKKINILINNNTNSKNKEDGLTTKKKEKRINKKK